MDGNHDPSNNGRTITLNSARGVAASLPHLLGFHPRESLICLWVRDGLLAVTQRADLPQLVGWQPQAEIVEYVEAFVAAAAKVRADEVVVVIVDGSESMVTTLARVVSLAVEKRDVRLRSLLLVRGSQVREALDDTSAWEWIDTGSRQQAVADIGGAHPALTRSLIEAECDADPESTLATDCGDRRASIAAATTTLIELIEGAVDEVRLTDLDDRVLRDSCAGRAGRDIIMWWAARADMDDRRTLLEALLRCTRSSPPGHGGNVAAATSTVAWLCGDGVRANVALDRCLRDDPGNRMGELLSYALGSGIPPSEVAHWLGSASWPEVRDWQEPTDDARSNADSGIDSGSLVDEQAG